MAHSKWTEEQKFKALALAEATTIAEAARQTGIPSGTIKRWSAQANRTNEPGEPGELDEPNRTSRKIKAIAEEATQEAKEEVRRYVADRAKEVADEILDMVVASLTAINQVIQKGPNKDEPKAGWLRALVGAMHQGVEKHQLLTGKATSRQEQTGQVNLINEQRYHIIQEIVTDPVVAERVKAAYRRRIGAGAGQE